MSSINSKKVSAVDPDKNNVVPTRKITELLPDVDKPDLIEKFFNNTVNHAFQPEHSENVSGFIGKVVPYYDPEIEFYLPESTHDRSQYQLAPMVVSQTNSTVNHAMFYPDFLNLIRLQGGNDLNHDRLFREQYYSWAPPINIDMFINYQNYLWLPEIADPITSDIEIGFDDFEDGNPNGWILVNTYDDAPVSQQSNAFTTFLGRFSGTTDGSQAVFKTYSLNTTTTTANIEFDILKIDSWDTTAGVNATNGPESAFIYLNDGLALRYIPTVTPTSGSFSLPGSLSGTYSITTVVPSQQIGYGTWADTIYHVSLTVNGTGSFIKLGFGANFNQDIDDESLGIDNVSVKQTVQLVFEPDINDQDYIVISRDDVSRSPWSTNNRWYHIDDLTPEETDIAKNYRARRPIIEFNKNLELYNYGHSRIGDIDFLDNITSNPASINGQLSYSIDGTALINGMRILFTNSDIPNNFGWENSSWEGENNGNGSWDLSAGITATPGSLTFSNANPTGIITGGTNFDSVFTRGQKIKISGSNSDGFYYVEQVTPTSLFLRSQFTAPGVQAGEVTITVIPQDFKNKIYTVTGVGEFIILVEAESIADGDTVLVNSGTNAGTEYYWDEVLVEWVIAQTKETRNQKPLFKLYDISGVPLDDAGLYPNSNFAGGEIFSYSEVESELQPIDSYLDIRLDYDQYGEIVFENDLETTVYTYGTIVTEINGYYFYKDHVLDNYGNGWHLSPKQSSQRLLTSFNLTMDSSVFTLDYTPLDLVVSVNGDEVTNYTLNGKTVTFTSTITKNSIVELRYNTNDAPIRSSNTSYELPVNLTANPFNEEITTISRSDYLQHFLSLISNQDGFTGVASGINNYRNLDINLGVGTEILQHHNPLVKAMAVGSNANLNIINAIKYSEREYIRFKNKFINKITEFTTNASYNESMGAEAWMNAAITAINIAKSSQFPFSLNTIENSYIPSTPSRLGMFPTYTPSIFVDYTLKSPLLVIQGHDGSITPAFNDFRDDVMLAFENMIYDSIPQSYKGEEKKLYDIEDSISTPYKTSDYSIADFNQLLTPVILQWAAFEGIQFEDNDTYSEDDPYTYNYSSQGIPGYWRGIIKQYYGTDRPNTHPWEMFGFSEMPSWWETRYGPAPYKHNNPFLWEDMRNGIIFDGPRAGTYTEYARTGLPAPTDNQGKIFDPISLGLASQQIVTDRIKNWEVGDFAPAETVFRRSSHWPFAMAIIGYLMNPAKFFSYGWDLNAIYIAYPDSDSPQVIDQFSGKRPGVDVLIQGEGGYVSNGIQTWLVDYVMSNGQNYAELSTTIRGADVRLGYKTGGFVNQDTIRLMTDNVLARIPQENVNTFLYQNPSVREVVYSGVIIEKVSNGWTVSGYDVLNNFFYALSPDTNGKKIQVSVGQAKLRTYSDYTNTVVAIPYGTVFNTIQQMYDFLIGYGEWLKTQGWVIENYDPGTNASDDWSQMANDFIFWSQGRWALGATISLSPSSMNMKFATDHGFVENLNQLVNGVYSIVDVTGGVIDQSDTFVNRDGNEVIIQSNVPIFGIRIIVSEIEHVIILDNVTIFNDLIYSPKLNLYQPRLRLQATRSLDWVGRINAPGYFVRGDTIVPNFEKSVNDVRNYFDIEKQVENPLTQEIARRNIGYQSKSYLDQILISPTTQFQFYQGFIRNKGTLSTLSTLLRSGISSGSNDVTFYEEWALKLGEFGNIMNGMNAEFLLDATSLKTNVQLIEFSFARLTADLLLGDTVAYVENTESLPDSGIILIDDEKIRYASKDASSLQGLTRGVLGTSAAMHTELTNFGLVDNEYDSIITMNPSDPNWIMKPLLLTNKLFNTRSATGRRFNGEYLLPTDNRIAGYVYESDVIARYNTVFDFTNALTNLIQSRSLEINDQIWVDQLPSNDSKFPDQFQVYTVRPKGVSINQVPVNYAGTLSTVLSDSSTTITVNENTTNWPDSGLIQIETETIQYTSKSGNVLTIGQRGYNNTPIGSPFYDVNGDLSYIDFTVGTATNIEYSGFGEEVVLELSSNPYSAGDTVIFENFFVDYIDVSGPYEVVESFGNNIRINLEITEDSDVIFDNVYILDLIESRYENSFDFNENSYTFETFELAQAMDLFTSQITLVDARNIKAPGVVQIGTEEIAYQTVSENTLSGIARGYNSSAVSAHNIGDQVVRKKNIKVYIDSRNYINDQNGVWEVISNNGDNTWSVVRTQAERVDIETFKNLVLYNNTDNFAISHLQAFDPAKNYFAGQVAAEIDYRLDSDPCNYNISLWGPVQVGQVWWNTKSVMYENYESDTDFYRSNNWGKLSPFSSIEIYEWVESNVLPANWEASTNASDVYSTTNGEPYTDETGTTPYLTGTKISSNGQEKEIYYFWVKNLSSNPPFPGRTYSVLEIANIMTDPTSQGITWFAPCSPTGLLLANLNNMALGDNTSIQISYNNHKNLNDPHTQWLLMREGDALSIPPATFWDQMKYSMAGFNVLYQPVPDVNVDPINRYGNARRPRQSWFVDQTKATTEFFKAINRLFALDQIVDREHFDVLLAQADSPTPYGTVAASTRPIRPCEFSDPLNFSTDDTGVDSSFVVSNFVERDYLVESGVAIIGNQIMVEAGDDTGGFWRIYKVINISGPSSGWFQETCAESFKTTDFWDYADFTAPDYDELQNIVATYEHIEDVVMSTLSEGDYVEITDYDGDSSNHQAIMRVDGDVLVLLFRQNGTIQFNIDQFANDEYGNLNKKITNSYYTSGVPGLQLAIKYIVDLLKNSILTNVEANLMFFKMINYVFSEQLNVDWAFKTTYIVGEGLNQTATQSPVFIFNRSQSFIDYIQEAKPYHTKLRDFRINQIIGTDVVPTIVTDFDKPVYFDENLDGYRVLDPSNPDDMAIMQDPESDQFWWSQFYDKPDRLIREIETTVYFDRVSCQASFGWDSAGFEDQVWEADVGEYLTAADRIVQSYRELPFSQTDVVQKKVTENLDLEDLIPGCVFRGTVVNNGTFKDLLQRPLYGWSSEDAAPWSNTPWSPLASGSNIIDISDYNAIYQGNTRTYKFTRTFNGDGMNDQFALGGTLLASDDVSVIVDERILGEDEFNREQVLYDPGDGVYVTQTAINLTVPPAASSVIRISVFGDDSFNEASVEESADIIVDGYLFKQPYIDSDHPEELVISSIGESLSIHVIADGIASDGKVINRIYAGNSYGPFDVGQTVVADESIMVFINGVLQPKDGSIYLINSDRTTITLRNNISITGNDRINIFSFGVGGEDIITEYNQPLTVDTSTFNLPGLASYPHPLVVIDGEYRTDYTLSGDDLVMDSVILAGSNVTIVVFKSGMYTQFMQKKFDFTGSNTFDLGVTLPSPENAIVTINGAAQAISGSFPDYTIVGQNLIMFNKVRGRAASYNNAGFQVNGSLVTGTDANTLASAIDNLPNLRSYVDKGQLVIANELGQPIIINDTAGGAGSMGIQSGTYNSSLVSTDDILVYMAPQDVAHYNTPTFQNVVEYAIPHDIIDASQVTVTVDGASVPYTINVTSNVVVLASDPGDGHWVEMTIKFINKKTFVGVDGGTYDLSFIPFSADQLIVMVNGLKAEYVADYTLSGQNMTIPKSSDGDEIQIFFFSSRNANGNGSFVLHFDQLNNRISQDYQAERIFTLGNAVNTTDTTFTINGLTDFNYGKLVLVDGLNVEVVYVREKDIVKRASISSYITLPNPVTTINQLIVVSEGNTLTPNVDYTLNGQQLSFTSPRTTVEITIRYLIGNIAYNVIRNYNYSYSYSFGAGTMMMISTENYAKGRLYRVGAENRTSLAQPLAWGDNEIHLLDASSLPMQDSGTARMDKPGTIWIDGERIEFWRRDGNTLKQVVRATGGTSAGYRESVNSTSRAQSVTVSASEYTQNGSQYMVTNPILTYINVGDTISVNGELVDVIESSTSTFTTNVLVAPQSELRITVYKPATTEIPAGTEVYNIGFEHEWEKGYSWVPSPFGLQFNEVDMMAKFINFDTNK